MAKEKALEQVFDRRLRKGTHVKKMGSWGIIVFSAFGIGLTASGFWAVPIIGAGLYLKFGLPKNDSLQAEEAEVMEALRTTANYNIDAAKKRARGESKAPMPFYSTLEEKMGKEFLFSAGDDELNWMKSIYDQMINHYIDTEAKLETAREKFRQLGRPKSNEMEAYFRGKGELTQEDRDLAELEKLLEG